MIRLYNWAHGQAVEDDIDLHIDRVQAYLDEVKAVCDSLGLPRVYVPRTAGHPYRLATVFDA